MASDLEHFVKFLIEDEVMNATLPWGESNYPADLWPFNKETMLKRDPAIESFTGVAIPWEIADLPLDSLRHWDLN